MNKKILIYPIYFFSFLFFWINSSQAITVLNPITEDQEGRIFFDDNPTSSLQIVADIGLYDGKIIEQSEEKLKISFEIVNNDQKTHSDLVYAVELIEKIEGPIGVSRIKKVYNEKINLIEKQKIKKEIEFEIPKYLSGNFEVSVSLADLNGLLMAINSFGEIYLERKQSFVEINMEKCYLTISSEDKLEAQRYSMMEGVVVTKEENLLVNCEIKNHFNEIKTVVPKLEFYERSLYGNKVDLNLSVDEKFNLDPNETKLFQFSLPKPEKPQAYSILMNLVENDSVVSNQAKIHFVVGGIGATIQSVSLDRNYYKKGDKLGLTLLLSGPAEFFPGSRKKSADLEMMATEIKIRNSSDEICLNIEDQIATSYPIAEYRDLEVYTDCYNPIIQVIVRDQEGNILAEREVRVLSDIDQNNMNTARDQKSIFLVVIFIGFFSILTLVSGFLLVRNLIKNKSNF